MTAPTRHDRLAATARAVVLAYCVALQTFFAAYFTGASAAPSPADLAGAGICTPSRGVDGGAAGGPPAAAPGDDAAACLARCLGVLASATPVAAPVVARPAFLIIAEVAAGVGAPRPVLAAGAGPLGARAPPVPIL